MCCVSRVLYHVCRVYHGECVLCVVFIMESVCCVCCVHVLTCVFITRVVLCVVFTTCKDVHVQCMTLEVS